MNVTDVRIRIGFGWRMIKAIPDLFRLAGRAAIWGFGRIDDPKEAIYAAPGGEAELDRIIRKVMRPMVEEADSFGLLCGHAEGDTICVINKDHEGDHKFWPKNWKDEK